MSMIIKLHHPTDPRWLIVDVDELPDQISMQDLIEWKYGKLMILSPGEADAVYYKDSESDNFVFASKREQ